MNFGNDEIRDLSIDIWKTVLDLELKVADDNQLLRTSDGLMTSCVQITGEWEGAVAVYCTSSLARKAAAIVFDKPNEAINFEEMQDILGEIANITGGNIKSSLPGSAALSLPSVVEGRDYRFGILGSELVAEVKFSCLDEPLQIALLRRNPTEFQKGKKRSS